MLIFYYFVVFPADFLVLAWGMLLSFKVRKVPQVYNESRFISYATYNAMFIICFITVLRWDKEWTKFSYQTPGRFNMPYLFNKLGHLVRHDIDKKDPQTFIHWSGGIKTLYEDVVNHVDAPTLPGSCGAFSQAFTVNWFRWHFRGDRTTWPRNDWPRWNFKA